MSSLLTAGPLSCTMLFEKALYGVDALPSCRAEDHHWKEVS